MKRDLVGVEWRTRMRDRVETIGGDSSKTGLVMKKGKHKSTTGIGASLTLDYREKEEGNNNMPQGMANHNILNMVVWKQSPWQIQLKLICEYDHQVGT